MSAGKALIVLTVLAIGVFLFFVLMRNMKAGSTTSGSGSNIIERVANSLQFGVTGSSNLGATGSGTGSSNVSKPPVRPNNIVGAGGSASKTVAAQPKLSVSGSGSSNLGASGSGTGGVTLDKCQGKNVFCCATGLC